VAGSVSDADILRETSAAHEADPKIPVRSVAEESDLTADRLSWTQGATMGVEGLGGCFLIVSFAGTPADKKKHQRKTIPFFGKSVLLRNQNNNHVTRHIIISFERHQSENLLGYGFGIVGL
jgi:hypothetical protein